MNCTRLTWVYVSWRGVTLSSRAVLHLYANCMGKDQANDRSKKWGWRGCRYCPPRRSLTPGMVLFQGAERARRPAVPVFPRPLVWLCFRGRRGRGGPTPRPALPRPGPGRDDGRGGGHGRAALQLRRALPPAAHRQRECFGDETWGKCMSNLV